MKKSLDSMIEELVMYMTIGEFKDGQRLKLSEFSDAEPFMGEFLEASNNGDRLFFTDVNPEDLSEPLDISFFAGIDHDGVPGPEKFHVTRMRRALPKEFRGRTVRYSKDMYEHLFAFFAEDGKYLSTKHFVGFINGKLFDCSPGSVLEKGDLDRLAMVIKTTRGIQFSRRYEWRVSLGYIGSPTISFATDPLGAREVFRLRDLPEGKARRTALRHWVRDHWRKKKRDDPESLVFVQEHLRGATLFTWNGLLCKVTPARYDLERLEAKKAAQ
jgi:hypothetical protein